MKRVISGMIMILMVMAIFILGNTTIIDISISTIAIIAINEYFHSFKDKKNVDKWIGNILAILIAFIGIVPKVYIILMFLTAIMLLFIKVIVTKMKTNFEDIAISGFGIIYIIGFLTFIPLIYRLENGRFLIWYLAIAAWATDTFAYLIGMKFGKHKLTPISPKKSIEGSIGGTIGAVIISLIYTYILNRMTMVDISYLLITGITIILSILGQIGDLSASSIKRFNNIKDFGKLIPGHGGILDRIDSILMIAPFAYFLLILM